MVNQQLRVYAPHVEQRCSESGRVKAPQYYKYDKAGYYSLECPAFLLQARQQQAIIIAQESGSISLLKIRDEFTQSLLSLSDAEYLVTQAEITSVNNSRRFTKDLLYITYRTYGETSAAASIGCTTKDIFPSLTI